MLEEVLSSLHLLILLGFLDVRGAKMKRHVMRKQMIQCSGFFFLFLKTSDFTLARVKVQFPSYFIDSAGPSLMRISAPRVPRSCRGVRFPPPRSCITQLNSKVARTWPNIENRACFISLPWKNRSIWLFLVQYFQMYCPNCELCYFISASAETGDNFFFNKNQLSWIPQMLVSLCQLCYPLF